MALPSSSFSYIWPSKERSSIAPCTCILPVCQNFLFLIVWKEPLIQTIARNLPNGAVQLSFGGRAFLTGYLGHTLFGHGSFSLRSVCRHAYILANCSHWLQRRWLEVCPNPVPISHLRFLTRFVTSFRYYLASTAPGRLRLIA
jgi:hypothetical protein